MPIRQPSLRQSPAANGHGPQGDVFLLRFNIKKISNCNKSPQLRCDLHQLHLASPVASIAVLDKGPKPVIKASINCWKLFMG